MRQARQWVLLGCALVVLTGVLFAKKSWEKPYTEWNKKDAQRVLNDSPWADSYVRTRSYAGRGSGLRGEKEVRDVFLVRYFSALPIRHAYLRLIQIGNNYAELGPEQKAAFDRKFGGLATRDYSDQIIVALIFESNDPDLSLQIERNLRVNTAEFFRQGCFLISDRLGRVELAEYYPPSPDGTGAKFIFPREVDGQPVASPEDKEVKFEFNAPDFGRVLVTQKIKEMIYNGKLEI